MGKTTSSTQQQSSERNPFAPAVPLLENAANQALQYGNAETFAPNYSADTMAGLDRLSALSQSPNNLQSVLPDQISGAQSALGQGLGQLQATAGGDYLDGNPYLMSVLDRGADRVQDRVNRSMSGLGRYGSGAHTGILSRNLGDYYNSALMNNYNTERGYQVNAGNNLLNYGSQTPQLAGMLDQANQGQANLQLTTGQMQDQMDQDERMAGINAANYLAGIGGQIGGMGGTTTGESKTQQRTPMNIPGMVASGVGMAMAPQFGLFGGRSPLVGNAFNVRHNVGRGVGQSDDTGIF